jgi:hypothetical protein
MLVLYTGAMIPSGPAMYLENFVSTLEQVG